MSPDNPIFNQRVTINPYRGFARGCFELWKRFEWDLNPESWKSRSKLKTLKNSYLGQKAVILCNGPSLLKHDLSILNKTFTFGLNKINLIFDKSPFIPSCIVSIDPIVLGQNADFYNQTEIPLFLERISSSLIKPRSNITFLYSSNSNAYQFARDCSLNIGQAGTVTFAALQLAFHMGFSDVALIGCDHNYGEKAPPNTVLTSDGADQNHFDPNYFSIGMKWQVPNMAVLELGYTIARNAYAAYGRRVVNCTEGGKLEVFERMNLNSWLEQTLSN
ncbi:6-hydroxymethylpterin diphosphokinase MptE-like protein [Nostoc sp. CALU 1950]|uniref:6-hydroxymethylpterin diphosphokinase MptE-like protein n=1 Tax=Nostoc sp. CALU 1950 TaxID=3104321 RepID=UPI003EB9760E